jgi:pimeloyl-ACP methyl ester carboxylesterase
VPQAALRPSAQVVERTFQTWDGTELAYQSVGEGPTILLSNGLGGTFAAWRHLVDYFGNRFRLVSWDYRGLYRSALPSDATRITVHDHARDAEALLRHLGIARAVVVGWSMGVQVNFELYRNAPALFDALIVVNGTYGLPFETAFNIKLAKHLLPGIATFAGRNAHLWVPALRWLVGHPRFMPVLKRTRVVAETLDEQVFKELASDYSELNFPVYMETIKNLGSHTAEDLLPQVQVPTLIVAGDRDLFTPLATAERMRREIQGAELLVVRTGTHYLPVEFPELVNLRIEKFLRDHGLLQVEPEPAIRAAE